MARTVGLEHFYVKIKKLILMAQGYTEIKYIDTLIKMCRLKPYSIMFERAPKRIELHRRWIDEHGNSLYITKKKKLQITLDDLTIDRTKLTSTDLYEGLSIRQTAVMSKVIFLLIGKEKITQQEHYVLSFLGIDDYLRTFVFINNEWRLYPSLSLGLTVLKRIAMNTQLSHFKKLKHTETVLYPCTQQRVWLSCLPIAEELKKTLPDNFLAYITGNHNGEK